ncbi:MAG: hypothetical protein DRJ66_00355 [Thermoprotei archaeon]|nr:MAG: hypothetical protein DRJ66_00355 [Thermoprotei archaeon]RLF20418.1 MAG: hypothetical protein DRZ82_02565 [Thermoprotei archaeon]
MKMTAIVMAIFTILTSILITLLLLSATFPEEVPKDIVKLLTVVTLVIAITSIALQQRELKRASKEPKKIVIIRCDKCSYRLERSFKEGDYILKTVGQCSCGGLLYIDSIYVEKKVK